MAVATQARLGEAVIYTDHDGNQRAALVTGTTDTIRQPAPGIPHLRDGELHLIVFSASGAFEPRHNVREGNEPRCWRPMS